MAAFSSSTGICPGAETWPTAPKVMAEPKYSPHRRLTTPAPMDMVMMGRSAYFPLISWVASSRAMTSPGHRGILHLPQAEEQVSLVRRATEVVVGAHHRFPRGVDGLNVPADHLVPGEDLHIHGVRVSRLGHRGVQRRIGFHVDLLLAPLLPGAEGEQDGGLPQDLPQPLQCAQHLRQLEDILIEVHPPLHHVQGVGTELPGLLQDALGRSGHDGDDHLGLSAAHLDIAQHHCFHQNFLLCQISKYGGAAAGIPAAAPDPIFQKPSCFEMLLPSRALGAVPRCTLSAAARPAASPRRIQVIMTRMQAWAA